MKATTPIPSSPPPRGWFFYDSQCGLCRGFARRVDGLMTRLGYELISLHEPGVANRIGIQPDQLMRQGWLVTSDGDRFGGADILFHVARDVWWGRPVVWAASVPWLRSLIWTVYRWVAANRYGISRTCGIGQPTTWPRWVPLTVGMALSFVLKPLLPAWLFMWLLAFSIFWGFKWVTWYNLSEPVSLTRSIGYLAAWPGMNAERFCSPNRRIIKPSFTEWTWAVAKTGLSLITLYMLVPLVPPNHPLLAGWIGMIGIILFLHFGIFHLISLGWRTVGVDAPPIMVRPLLASSLGSFWSFRWNLAFRRLSFDFVFRPLLGRIGLQKATLATYLASGLVHDLLISVPAGAGYGLPTAYFALQGLGVLIEHSKTGKKLHLQGGFTGWMFTLLVTLGPVAWLFPPSFVQNVIIPFLKVIGSMKGGSIV